MFSFCRDLCRSQKDKDRAKKDKKDKHGSNASGKDEKAGSKHKMKNVHTFSVIGQGKKNTDQDSTSMFEMMEDNVLVRFFGIYDGHGDFGKEVIIIKS